jgi:hypothetical protein
MWFLPLVGGAILGAMLGRRFGQGEGLAMALIPVAYDPALASAYERSLGEGRPLTAAEQAMFQKSLKMARDYYDLIMLAPRPPAAPGSSVVTATMDLVTRRRLSPQSSAGYSMGADQAQLARLWSMVDAFVKNIENVRGILAFQTTTPHDCWNWSTCLDHVKMMAMQAATKIGPAIDAYTNGASQPATHHAWELNGEIALIPRPWDYFPYSHKQTGYDETLDRALNLATQMSALYAASLSHAA